MISHNIIYNNLLKINWEMLSDQILPYLTKHRTYTLELHNFLLSINCFTMIRVFTQSKLFSYTFLFNKFMKFTLNHSNYFTKTIKSIRLHSTKISYKYFVQISWKWLRQQLDASTCWQMPISRHKMKCS